MLCAALQIDYLLIKLQGEDTEREDHIARRDDLEGAYREECLANGIAADEIDNNIKKARTSYQPEGELQQMVHDAQMSVKFAQIQMKNTERILERTRKDLGAVDDKLEEREAQKQQLDGEVLRHVSTNKYTHTPGACTGSITNIST